MTRYCFLNEVISVLYSFIILPRYRGRLLLLSMTLTRQLRKGGVPWEVGPGQEDQ